MRVLLLGGTGAMGRQLSMLLAEQGHEVGVTSRKLHESSRSVKFFQGNAKDLSFLEEVLTEKWDAIIDFMVYKEKEFRERVTIILKNTNHYVFLSSARVYYDSSTPITEESARLLDASSDEVFLESEEYSLSKARQEDILRASDSKNWTIIRPYITYGKNRLQLGTLEKENWLYRALRDRTIVFSKEMMSKKTTMTDSYDVSKGISSIIGDDRSFNQIYHITNSKSYYWEEILNVYIDLLEKNLGFKPKVYLQSLDNFSKWNPGKYQIIYDRLFDRIFDNSKISKFVDVTEFTDVNEGLNKYLSEFCTNPTFLSINWKSEAMKDRICKERTPLKEIEGNKQRVKYLLYRYILPNN